VTTLYGIANCDTVKKARRWLAAEGIAHAFHDLRRDGLAPARLDGWIAALGWEALLNRKGTTWRALDPALREAPLDAAAARGLMLAQPTLIKRPVIEWPAGCSVGFDPARFDALRPR
jgi:Spx/MgsR family transcriptional regulator